VAPSPDAGVESADELRLWGGSPCSHVLFDLLEMGALSFCRWCDVGVASQWFSLPGCAGFVCAYRVLPDVEPPEVDPCDPCDRVSRMCDPGVPGLHYQPHALEPCGRNRLRLQTDLSVFMPHHTVVRVPDDSGLPPLAVLVGREGGFDGRFQPVQGPMCQSWGTHPPLRGTCFRREELGSLPHSRLEPGVNHPSQGGEGVQLGE